MTFFRYEKNGIHNEENWMKEIIFDQKWKENDQTMMMMMMQQTNKHRAQTINQTKCILTFTPKHTHHSKTSFIWFWRLGKTSNRKEKDQCAKQTKNKTTKTKKSYKQDKFVAILVSFLFVSDSGSFRILFDWNELKQRKTSLRKTNKNQKPRPEKIKKVRLTDFEWKEKFWDGFWMWSMFLSTELN